jgi:hypothetical protein
VADDELLGIILVVIGAGVLVFIGLPFLIFSLMAQSILGDIPGFVWAMTLAGIVPMVVGAILIVVGILINTRTVTANKATYHTYQAAPGTCPRCGRWIGSAGPFCPYCGTKRL